MATDKEEDEGEKFTIEETNFLTSVYLIVSEEQTILDSSHGVFWFCLGIKFREMKPAWVPDRDYDQLRHHWARVHKDISKFGAIVADCEKVWGRSHGELYAHYQAKEVFFTTQRRKFEFADVWEMLRIHNKYCSNRTKVEYSTSAAIDESRSKRCRSVATEGESFTIEETNFLACAYILVSEGTVDLSSSSEVFWFCVAEKFKELNAAGVPDRDSDQLRKHWDRVYKDVSKFAAIFASCQNKYQQAKEAFFRNEGRMFEYEDIWDFLWDRKKLCCSSEGASSGSKRSNVEDSMGDASSPATPRSRSMGTKAAKRKGKASIAPAQDPQLTEYSKIAEAMLIKEYSRMLARDTYMSKENRKFHQELLDFVRSKVIRK